MATIHRFTFLRHLRAEPNSHVLHYRKGKLVRSGRGLAFWYLPLNASLAEVPTCDLEQPFLFHARSSDFQEVTAQGAIAYRVADPERLAERVDFSLDLATGAFLKTPLEDLAQLFTKQAQQLAWGYLASTPIRQLLAEGVEAVRERVRVGLTDDPDLGLMGLHVVGVNVTRVAPTADLEKALQAPMREHIQQSADEATFARRALAVEKERAIAENELQNRIELAKRQELLINQEGANRIRETKEAAEAARLKAEGDAGNVRLKAAADADKIRLVDEAKFASERERLELYRGLPANVLWSLAAQELAGKLTRIDHLNLSPEALGPLLQSLMSAGAARLTEGGSA
ncbi:MAG: band 7 protein [Planctomycetes bacterium]|nr:band 7 protein [Planctomycetota bacterium]